MKTKKVNRFIALLLAVVMLMGSFPLMLTASAQEVTGVTADQPALQLTYDEPGADWEQEGLALGNGFIGASVYGEAGNEQILLNEHTIWDGGPGANANYEGGMDTILNGHSQEENWAALEEARKMLQEEMTAFTENHSAYINEETGELITSDYPAYLDPYSTSASADTIGFNALFNRLKGEKTNFGNYQELGVLNITDDDASVLVSATHNCPYGESMTILSDGVVNTTDGSWFSEGNGGSSDKGQTFPIFTWEYSNPLPIGSYTITLGIHSYLHNRCPVTFKLSGSMNGEDWILLDSQENVGWTSALQSKTFALAETVSYPYYQFEVTANNGTWGTEIGEFSLNVAEKAEEGAATQVSTSATSYDGQLSYLFDHYSCSAASSVFFKAQPTETAPVDVVMTYTKGKTIDSYSIWNGGDTIQYNRQPTAWMLYGSNDEGTTWTLLDTVSAETWAMVGEIKTYQLDAAPAAYTQYKLSITGNAGATGVTIGEIVLHDQQDATLTVTTTAPTTTEDPNQLFDGLYTQATSWFSHDGTSSASTPDCDFDVVAQYSEPQTINGYTLTSGYDARWCGRCPTAWTFYGSNDGDIWTLLDTRSNVAWDAVGTGRGNYTSNGFTLASPVTFSYYKFTFTENEGLIPGTESAAWGTELYEIAFAKVPTNAPVISSELYPRHAASVCRSDKLFDNDVTAGNKWYAADNSAYDLHGVGVTEANCVDTWIQVMLTSEIEIAAYGLVSANDAIWRDPTQWKLQGSHDGANWTDLDAQTRDTYFPARNTEYGYELAATANYRFYRLAVEATYSKKADGSASVGGPQLAELKFYNAEGEQVLIDGTVIENEVTDYQRTLDLNNAIASSSYKLGDVEYTQEYFVSNPDNFMAIRYTVSKTGALNRRIGITTAQPNATIVAEGDTLTITGMPRDAIETLDHLEFAGQIKVVTDGTVTAEQTTLHVEDATEMILYFAADTNYQQDMQNDGSYDYFQDLDPLTDELAPRLAEVAEGNYAEQKATHIADHKSLFDGMQLDLGIEKPAKHTDDLLDGYGTTNTAEEDLYLETLYYQFGRYQLIASSREGSLPANLQGIWNKGLDPRWDSDYHTNINVQMNYWLAENTNLEECVQPLVDYINAQVERGTEVAQMYHYAEDANGNKTPARGWTTYHENNIWGNSGPATSYAFYFPVGAAWLCQHIYDQYEYSRDTAQLAENWDTLIGAAIFWVDNLVVDTRDGSLSTSPSYSPEHGTYSIGATQDIAIVREIFTNTLDAAEVLNITNETHLGWLQEIETALGKLPEYEIGLGGQFQEWRDEVSLDLDSANGGSTKHNHVNHLYGLYPGSEIVPGRSEQDDLYAAAMKVTLNERGDAGSGWSRAWKIGLWARLRDGDRAHKLLASAISGSTYDNMFDLFPVAGTSLFQIDGNLGASASVGEMLLQSQGDAIELIPAIPAIWSEGAYTGMRARGNVEVDVAWAEGAPTTAVLRVGTADEALQVKGDMIAYSIVRDSAGQVVTISRNGNDSITFAAEAGETYTVDFTAAENMVGLVKALDYYDGKDVAHFADEDLGTVILRAKEIVNGDEATDEEIEELTNQLNASKGNYDAENLPNASEQAIYSDAPGYLVGSLAEMRAVAANVNAFKKGQTLYITADIDAENKAIYWTNIAADIDGLGHTIRNVNITNSWLGAYAGSSIKNITFEKFKASSISSETAIIMGCVSADLTLENITLDQCTGAVTGNNYQRSLLFGVTAGGGVDVAMKNITIKKSTLTLDPGNNSAALVFARCTTGDTVSIDGLYLYGNTISGIGTESVSFVVGQAQGAVHLKNVAIVGNKKLDAEDAPSTDEKLVFGYENTASGITNLIAGNNGGAVVAASETVSQELVFPNVRLTGADIYNANLAIADANDASLNLWTLKNGEIVAVDAKNAAPVTVTFGETVLYTDYAGKLTGTVPTGNWYLNDTYVADPTTRVYTEATTFTAKAADKAALELAIDNAEDLKVNGELTAAQKSALEALLETANTVYDDEAAIQTAANAAAKALNDWMMGDADYTAVNAAIKKAEALTASNYLDFSAVTAALEAVVTGKKVTEQAAVNKMAKDIEDAIKALKLKEVRITGIKGEDPTIEGEEITLIAEGTSIKVTFVTEGTVKKLTVSAAQGSDVTIAADKNGAFTLPLGNARKNVYYVTVTGESGSKEYTLTITRDADGVTYKDVPKNKKQWYTNAVYAATEQGYVTGTRNSDGWYFMPTNKTTREQMAVIMVKVKGINASLFSDVKLPYADQNTISGWALDYMKAAYATGLMSGAQSGNKLYGNPQKNVTRVEAMIMVYNLLGETVNGDLSGFKDKSTVPAWAEKQVKTVVGLGIIVGSGGYLNLNNNITRAEIAVILQKIDDYRYNG